ncbi:MAG TPA: ROK family protein, partial [Kofleriaceae bacterium]|nr:ROK family protein [Kofleriaceae bacterium]
MPTLPPAKGSPSSKGLPATAAVTGGAQTALRSPASKLATLAIDIGGTGLKALLLAPDGSAQTERVRVPTPKPATTTAVLDALVALVEPLTFDRVSVGFPGVVV